MDDSDVVDEDDNEGGKDVRYFSCGSNEWFCSWDVWFSKLITSWCASKWFDLRLFTTFLKLSQSEVNLFLHSLAAIIKNIRFEEVQWLYKLYLSIKKTQKKKSNKLTTMF